MKLDKKQLEMIRILYIAMKIELQKQLEPLKKSLNSTEEQKLKELWVEKGDYGALEEWFDRKLDSML